MGESFGGTFQGEFLASLPDIRLSSSEGGPNSGDLVAARLGPETESGDRRVRLVPGGQTTRVSAPSNLGDGTLLLGRVERARDQLHVRLLQRRSEFKNISRRELTGLLRNLDVSASSEQLDAVRRQLGNQGYLRPSAFRSSESMPDPSRLVEAVNRDRSSGSVRGSVLKAPASTAASLETGPGKTVTATVQGDSSGGRVQLGIQGKLVQVETPVELQEGTRLLLRVQSGSDSTRLEILSRSRDPRSIPTLSTQARSDRLGTELQLLTDGTRTPSLRAGETVSVQVLQDVDSGQVRLRIKGQSVPARSSVALRAGTEFKATVHGEDPRFRLEVVSVSRDASQIPNRAAAEVLDRLGMETSRENLHRFKSLLARHGQGSVDRLLGTLTSEWNFETHPGDAGVRDRLGSLLETVQSTQDHNRSQFFQSIDNLNTGELKQLLRDLGFHPNERTLRAARRLLNADPNPSKQVLRQALQNLGVAQNASGELESNRLKALLFLVRNDLPVNESILDQVSRAGETLSSAAENSSVETALQPVNPGDGQLASQLREALASVGFDLERRLTRDPDHARGTTRAQLESAFSGNSGQGEAGSQGAREMMGQILKHSLASVGEDGKMYLFVPFEDGEETRMMRVRLEDRREAEGEADDEHWSVTVDLELSRLGPLRVQANRSRSKLSLTFQASETRTRSLLRNRQSELREPLEERGFEVYLQTAPMEPSSYGLLGETSWFDEGETTTFDVTV